MFFGDFQIYGNFIEGNLNIWRVGKKFIAQTPCDIASYRKHMWSLYAFDISLNFMFLCCELSIS